ncbi:uncharacterized protein LOC135384989 [Ornithodoros turicata]|uniref:uncharacterized protein LOC135384989 n=1 Tax=Ornithodoros turicata TaxID=34597 RepID=UPI00313986B8
MSVVTRLGAKKGNSDTDEGDILGDAQNVEHATNEDSSGGSSDREIEKLRLQLEIERIKLAQIQAGGDSGYRPNTEHRSRVGEYARDLRGVLTAMPESEALVPEWFVSVETVFKNFGVPEDIQGTVLLAYLNEKMRAVIARHGNGTILLYPEVKEKVLAELRLTPAEYKRHFYQARKGDSESWGQFLTRLSALFDHYTASRNVKTLDDLRDLILVDRLTYVMSDETRSYVTLADTGKWHRPDKVVEMAENFEETKRGAKQRRTVAPATQRRPPEAREKIVPGKNNAGSRVPMPTREMSGRVVHCYNCKEEGHYARQCPQTSAKQTGSRCNEPRVRQNDSSKLVAKVALLHGDQMSSTIERAKEGVTADLVTLRVGDRVVKARLDSGADITVLKRNIVSFPDSEIESGEIRLRGAFGHTVGAQLMEIPLGIETEDGCGQQVLTLCAVTEELAQGIDALITPHDFEEIRNVNEELGREAAELASMGSIGIEQIKCRETTDEDEVDEEVEQNQNASINVVSSEIDAEPEIRSEESRRFAAEQREDVSLKESWEHAKEGSHGMIVIDGLLYHNDRTDYGDCRQLVLPISRRNEVLTLAHDSPWGGHFSQKKTKQRVKSAFYWPSVATDIKRYCQSCHGCQMFSKARSTDRVPITPLTRPEEPFRVLYMDCIGPLDPPSARGHRYALCIVDLCTRWPEVVPLRSLTAKATCQALVDVFARYGVPETICCDQGTNFTSKLTQELAQRMGVQMRFSTPDHPQSNGLVERWNGTFKAMLRHVVDEEGREWDRYIPCLLWAYREVPNEITGVSPFQLMFGRAPHGPLGILQQTWAGDWTPPTGLNKPAGEYLGQLRERMSKMSREVSERVQSAQEAYAGRYNLRAHAKAFQPGDKVLVLEPESANKMKAKWKGPAEVTERVRPDSYRVKMPDGSERWVHANKLRSYIARVDAVGVIFDEDVEFGEVNTCPVPTTQDCPRVVDNSANQLNAKQKTELDELVAEYHEVFSENPGKCNVGSHHIRLVPGAKLDRGHIYKVPVALRGEVDKQVEELLRWDFIYPVESNVAHPVVCVSKRDGTMRMCVDYRKLNTVTEQDRFPMENITELIYKVSKSRFISVLDMTRGYWQIQMDPESQKYTAFATPSGLYAWNVMPYGLRNSAATFQRVMNGLLRRHRDYTCVYIDDIAIHSNSWEEHVRHLRAVLSTLRESGLTANIKKCRFGEPKVKYLGHWVGSGVHSPDPDNVAAIMKLQLPTDKKGVRSALGMFNYYREYIPNYSELVLPLTNLTNRRVPNKLPWNAEAKKAFEVVKEKLAKIPELVSPDPRHGYTLTTDASEKAVGACLSQRIDGQERPIAFLSKKLSDSQSKWSTIEREAFAIVWALGRLDTWLFGAKIKVLTDHNPLAYLARSSPSSARLTRWSLALQKYELEISHIKGSHNKCADALSRLDF